MAATAYALRGGHSRAQDDGVEVASGLVIRRRSAWDGGRGPTGSLESEEVRFLLVHHTASGNGYSQTEAPGVMRSAFDFHTGPDKGWPDVAYNFFVDRYGGVWEGRTGSLDGPVRADATGGSQGFAQLVCLIGDFTSVLPSDAALDALTRVLAWLGERHGIDTSVGATTEFVSRGSQLWPAGSSVTAATISGHRDMSSTACPGDTFYPYLVAEMASRVSALRGGSPQMTATAPPVATTTTAAVAAPSSAPVTTSPPEPPSTAVTSSTTTSSIPSTRPVDASTTTASVPTSSTAVMADTTTPASTTTHDGGDVAERSGDGDGDGGSLVALTAISVGAGAAALGVFALRRRTQVAPDEDDPNAPQP